MAELRGWVAKFRGDGWLSFGGWVAEVKFVALPLATAALYRIESRHLSKIINWWHEQMSGQHTLARKKYI